MALDHIDAQLLARLQQDGRVPVAQLAREVHLSVTPCLERVRHLEARGLIRGYHADLDPQRLGQQLLAYIEVSLDRTTPDVFATPSKPSFVSSRSPALRFFSSGP